MKSLVHILSLILLLAACSKEEHKAYVYVTTADEGKKMHKEYILKGSIVSDSNTITLDPSIRYQSIDGFGVALTGSSCFNLLKMDPIDRKSLLKETFDPIEGYGYSYIRISIGTSDFALDEYTYCDKPEIENFRIHEYDKRDLFPILREVLEINPELKIMASPWTCPQWMKVKDLNSLEPFNSWTSGQLNPLYYEDYATYFVKYIQAMKEEGFDITSITIQNEPLNRGNSASLYMTWQEQRDFIKSDLGPAFKENDIETKIIVFDHNFDYDIWKDETKDQGQYPLRIYEDEEAAQYIDGAAYHAYGGNASELETIYAARPDKNIYFTEISIGMWDNGYTFESDLMWNFRNVCIGTLNRFSKAVILWNFMLDDKHGPNRPGGCLNCLGAIDIDSKDYKTMRKNSHYYIVAHLSQVIKPNAMRIEAKGKMEEGLLYSAFENPDGSQSIILMNDTEKIIPININAKDNLYSHQVEPKSVNSFIFN